jgi:RNA polymerase sigma factor (TIGR02999 family)
MASERGDHTLQPTAVVHEAYFRLCGSSGSRWENRAHFFGAAAQAMRQILIDHARRKASFKRGGDQIRVDLPEFAGKWEDQVEELLALDEALEALEARDSQMAEVVKLRFFVGLTIDEIASALDLSHRSVSRSWAGAKAWLRREMTA